MQVKVFKEDNFTSVDVVSGKPVSTVRIRDKDVKWEQFSSADDIIDLDSHYKGKDFVYAYALAEINAQKAEDVFLGVGSDDGIKSVAQWQACS